MSKNVVFSELILKHSEGIQRFIYTITRDNYAKDEIFQNTIIRGYKSFECLKNKDSFLPWMLSISRTETARYYKAEKVWRDITSFEEGSLQDVYDSREDFKKIENYELNEDLRELICSLKPEIAQVIILYFYYEMNLKEIAKTLNRNYNTVKSQYLRGVDLVKQRYSKTVRVKGEVTWMTVD